MTVTPQTAEHTESDETAPLETAEELSKVAFGFMASKALFGGLHIDLFTRLSDGAMTAAEMAAATGVPENRVTTLATALASVGALTRDAAGRYANAPAAELFLARGSKHDFGDYLRHQIDRQMYPFLGQLNQALDGSLNPEDVESYAHWMSDPAQAALYSKSQHAGSLGPGRSLARKADLAGRKTLLDVGGGTGAMTISLLEAHDALTATIIDFPNVAEIGWRFVAEAGLVNRVRYVPGDALNCVWPTEQDTVLMSYLLSGVPGEKIPDLLAAAARSLEPGGLVMIHDFMVERNRRGPTLAALWQLQHMAFTPDARSLAVDWLEEAMRAAGFVEIEIDDLVPGMTKLAVGVLPKSG